MKKKSRKEKIEKEVQKTLECFDQIETIKSSSAFFTRIQGRIQESEKKSGRQGFLFLRAGFLKSAMLMIIIVLNFFFFIQAFKSGKTQPETREKYISSMASYYNLKSNNLDSLFSSK